MCVSVVSDSDVRCYQQCQYGEGIETFVVPDQKTCMQYDSAYKNTAADFGNRKQVLEGVASFIFQQAVKKAVLRAQGLNGGIRFNGSNHNGTVDRPLDLTRELIGDGIQDLEDEGLGALEDAGCAAFTGPAAPFCAWAFKSPIGQYVNNEIEQIPVVQHVANWLGNTADEMVPSGVRNCVDSVSDAYNAYKTGSRFISACETAGSAITSGLFGWL